MDPFTLLMLGGLASGAGQNLYSLFGQRRANRATQRNLAVERAQLEEAKKNALIGQEEANAVGNLGGDIAQQRLAKIRRAYNLSDLRANQQQRDFARSQRAQTFADLAGIGGNLATGLAYLTPGESEAQGIFRGNRYQYG